VSDPRQQSFDAWLAGPIGRESADARYDVRRARPDDFEAIFDLVDAAFGRKRARAEYDWLYRRNPRGFARCWITVERESGRIAASIALWPWRAAHGDQFVPGGLTGDSVVAPQLQRQRVSHVRMGVARSHLGRADELVFAWMNERSVARLRAQRRTGRLKGPLPRRVLYLSGRARVARRGWPRPLAAGVGAALDAGGALRGRALGSGLRAEDVSQFDSRFDALSWRAMRWDRFWFPRDAAFLNWRYLAHPTREYRCLALLRGEEPAAYCVLRLDGARATLMEFAAPEARSDAALLRAAARAARESGCDRLEIFATPDWRCWPALRAAGFLERPSVHYAFLRSRDEAQSRLDEWQLLPGDHDAW
jgi:hypothetical protein